MSSKNSKKAVLLSAALLGFAVSSAFAALEPGEASGLVGQMVAQILERNHYNHHPFDANTSKEFLRNYLETYDYNHMFLEKADVDEFGARYGESLAEKMKEGDVQPAFEIFERFMKRLEEREAFVRQTAAATDNFTADESYAPDRHEAPWPATPQEAQGLWRLRVKQELLQERLSAGPSGSGAKPDKESSSGPGKAKPEEQAKTVTLRYERLLRSYKEYDASDVLQNYLTALAHTFDPHSDYMAAPQMENFNISMRLSLVGIGAVLRSEDGYAKIVSLVPGGPADLDKRLKPNDRIEAVAQGEGPFVEAVGMKLDRLVQLIRGEKGTVVRLRVIPADALDSSIRVAVSIVRDEIKLRDQEAKAKLLSLPIASGKTAKIGVIDLPSFYADTKSVIEPKSTTRDVEKLLAHLKKEGIDGLILDLRRNGGGSLPESVALTGLFIPEGPVVQVKDARGLTKVLKDAEPGLAYSGPMVVLTNHASASASEILAAALQDYGRAVIVGEKSTFGKGTVQQIVELSQYLPGALRTYKPGAVKLTIQKFYRISGGSTQNRGVLPDIRLPSLTDYMELTETALKSALPYDEVDPSPYGRMNFLTPAKLKELQKASAQRLASSPELGYVREDIEIFKKQKEEKTVSLNEKKRLGEKKAEEERTQARKRERAARKTQPLAATEITLESVEGLKPPSTSTAPVTVEAEGPDYEKAPPVPDIALEESAHVLADLIGSAPPSGTAGTISIDTLTP